MSFAYRILCSSHSLLNTIFSNLILLTFGLTGNDRRAAVYFFTSITTKNLTLGNIRPIDQEDQLFNCTTPMIKLFSIIMLRDLD